MYTASKYSAIEMISTAEQVTSALETNGSGVWFLALYEPLSMFSELGYSDFSSTYHLGTAS